MNKVDECLADYTPERKDELAQWKESLQEQLQKVTTLSDQILALIRQKANNNNEKGVHGVILILRDASNSLATC